MAASPGANVDRWRMDLARIEDEATALERDLTTRSRAFAGRRPVTAPTWQAIRSQLKSGEAAVEYVRFPFFDGTRWTGATYYAALVVTPGTAEAPAFVPLGEARRSSAGP